jgi:hypothetical protein
VQKFAHSELLRILQFLLSAYRGELLMLADELTGGAIFGR